MRTSHRCIGTVITLVMIACGPASGQGRVQELPVGAILARVQHPSLTETSAIETAAAVLAQTRESVPPARIDSLATGLVKLAVESAAPASGGAITAFVLAADRTNTRRYTGSFDRLLEIYHGSKDAGRRGAALSALARVGETKRALTVWTEIAKLDKPDQSFLAAPERAITYLCVYGGSEGREILAELKRTDAVRAPRAASVLTIMIESNFKVGCDPV